MPAAMSRRTGRNRTLTAVATVAKAKGAKQSMIAQAENIRCVSLEGKARALPIGRNRTSERRVNHTTQRLCNGGVRAHR